MKGGRGNGSKEKNGRRTRNEGKAGGDESKKMMTEKTDNIL